MLIWQPGMFMQVFFWVFWLFLLFSYWQLRVVVVESPTENIKTSKIVILFWTQLAQGMPAACARGVMHKMSTGHVCL